jgi:hypothetical protein
MSASRYLHRDVASRCLRDGSALAFSAKDQNGTCAFGLLAGRLSSLDRENKDGRSQQMR